MVKYRLCISALFFLFASPAAAVTYSDFIWLWPHSYPVYDLSEKAILGSVEDFDEWRRDSGQQIRAKFDAVPIPTPVSDFDEGWMQLPGYKLMQVVVNFPVGFIEGPGSYVGGFLAVPDVVDPSKPFVIALHGHEVSHRGEPPETLFSEHWWPEKLAQAGYAVWAPSHLLYKQLASLYTEHDYHVVWTKFTSVVLDRVARWFPVHNGYVVAGLSAGGTTASFLMAYRADIQRGVFAGSLFSLDYARENIRFAGHPDNWDVKFVNSYLPIYALIVPRPVEWQMGRADTLLFPRTSPVPESQPSFPGAPRGVESGEFFGEFMVAQSLWRKHGGEPRLYIHDGGHEFVVEEAIRFLQQ